MIRSRRRQDALVGPAHTKQVEQYPHRSGSFPLVPPFRQVRPQHTQMPILSLTKYSYVLMLRGLATFHSLGCSQESGILILVVG